MTVSWFRSDSMKLSIKEAAKALYPPRTSHWERRPDDRNRFSTLLLDHGEKHIQDWAVIAYTTPLNPSGPSSFVTSPHRKPGKTTWAQSTTASNRKLTSETTASIKRKMATTKKPKRIDKEAYPTAHMTKIEGRLHLCSLSIVFEPNDPSRGIVRCPFQRMDSAPHEYPPETSASTSTGSYESMCVEFSSTRHTVMKENNSIGPFESVPIPTLFRFTFLHSSPTSLVELCRKLFHILHHTTDKKHGLHVTPELDELLRPMLDRPFDPTNLMDVRERSLTTNLRCSLLLPLQNKPGCVVLTDERLYFQPASGVLSLETPRAKSWLLSQVVATARRYHGLKDSALELYWRDASPSVLLAFERKHEREQILRLLPPNTPCHTDREFVVQASQDWQTGRISNYEYLLILNSAAGRTFHDLSRYPVFPWVIADYESTKLDLTKPSTFRDLTKPVGALNEQRLNYFRQRYESMHDMDDPFLYGTHYSAAGYVLYYLVRSMPEHMLCLQNGTFLNLFVPMIDDWSS